MFIVYIVYIIKLPFSNYSDIQNIELVAWILSR